MVLTEGRLNESFLVTLGRVCGILTAPLPKAVLNLYHHNAIAIVSKTIHFVPTVRVTYVAMH
jgi:hypothetical protein